MNITVYLASSTGNDPKFEAAVKELGTWIGAVVIRWFMAVLKPPDGRAGAKCSAGRW